MSSPPLVSIGLPVYDGMPYLRTAVETLLKQDYPHLEIIISDNASTDGTSEYCRALAEVHARVQYLRNSENVGPSENFRRVLGHASGEYFMWASHDDKWSEHYVSALVRTLGARPDAVLATPTVIHIRPDGTLCNEPPDRPATGASEMGNLALLYEDHAASWIYGLWQIAWLRAHVEEYFALPFWGADVMWLADICLRLPVVGDQEAVIFKRLRRNSAAPNTARAAVGFWFAMFWHLSRACWRRTSGFQQRTRSLALSWRYVYRLCIRRPYLLRTAWRVVRMLSLAAITSVALLIVDRWRKLTETLKRLPVQSG